MIKKIIFIITLLMFSSLALGATYSFGQPYSFIFKQSTAVNFTIPVFQGNNSIATNITTCYLTLTDPQRITLVADKQMTLDNASKQFYYNILGGNFSTLGVYPTVVRCDDTTNFGFSSFSIYVTPNGTKDRQDGMTFLIIGVIYIFITAIIFYGLVTSKKNHWKIIFFDGFFIMLVALLKLSGWFLYVTYPEQTDMINTLDIFYGFGVNGLWFVIIVSMFFLLYQAFAVLKDRDRSKKDEEWNW